MSKHVIETVMFKLNNGVTTPEFIKAAQATNAWVSAQAGFVARRLSCSDDGTWIEHIEWADMASAKAAAEAMPQEPGNMPLLSAIDETSIQLSHSELKIAVN